MSNKKDDFCMLQAYADSHEFHGSELSARRRRRIRCCVAGSRRSTPTTRIRCSVTSTR
jgi:hypothetical protein